jgi:ribosomal protein S18 acetylase RimI-like enzyme
VNEPPGFSVGPLAREHRARVAEILRSTENFRDEEIDVALELFDESFVGEEYVFIAAFAAGAALVGFACFGPTMSTDRTYDLYWIAVDRAAHGSGCGSVLLAEVERRLEALHARMLVVETSSRSDYTATRGFYLKRGYVEAARVREFYAPEDDRIILTKRLAGSPRQGWGAVA